MTTQTWMTFFRHTRIMVLMVAPCWYLLSLPALGASNNEWNNEFKTDDMTDERRGWASITFDAPVTPQHLLYEHDTVNTAAVSFSIMCFEGRLQILAMHLGVGKLQTPRVLYRFDKDKHGEFVFSGDNRLLIGVLQTWADESVGHERLLTSLMKTHDRLLVRFNADGPHSDVEFNLDGAAEAIAKAATFGGCDLSEYIGDRAGESH